MTKNCLFIKLAEKQLRSNAMKSHERREDCEIAHKRSSCEGEKKFKIRDYHNVAIQQRTFTPKSYLLSIADVPGKPHEILELVLSDQVFEVLTKYTVMYSEQHRNHKFTLGVEEMKAFMAVLLLSGLCSVSQRRIPSVFRQYIHSTETFRLNS